MLWQPPFSMTSGARVSLRGSGLRKSPASQQGPLAQLKVGAAFGRPSQLPHGVLELLLLIPLGDQYGGLGNELIAAAESVYFGLATAKELQWLGTRCSS